MKLHLIPLQSCSLICALQSLIRLSALVKAKSEEGKHGAVSKEPINDVQ